MNDWNYENEQWTKLPTHLKHLPLFTRQQDWVSAFFRYAWAGFLKYGAFFLLIRLKVVGDYRKIYLEHPRLIIISNHASHLDAVSIAASIPVRYWNHLFIAAAKDYFFTNPIFTFFSQHCLGAIPIDRKDRRGEAIRLITTLLQGLDRMWLILFPEGTRSKDGKIHDFKRGVSVFAEKTKTPILFLFLEGNSELMPKGSFIPRPGKLTIHIGPVIKPAPIEEIFAAYRSWVLNIDPDAFAENVNLGAPVPGMPVSTEDIDDTIDDNPDEMSTDLADLADENELDSGKEDE